MRTRWEVSSETGSGISPRLISSRSAGHHSHALYAVRSGALKSYCITEDGDEQVLGFILPGELTGMDGLSGGSYASASVALETSCVCELPFDKLNSLCSQLPGMHEQIMRIVGKEITADQQMLMLLGKCNAEERLASFILSLSSRYKKRGLSPNEFYLPMSRQDIGNYLGLAIETVSRLFARLQDEGILAVDRKLVTIRKPASLDSMVVGEPQILGQTTGLSLLRLLSKKFREF